MLNCYIFENKLKTIKVKLLDHNCTRRLNRCKTKNFCTERGNKRCISNFCILRRKKNYTVCAGCCYGILIFRIILTCQTLILQYFFVYRNICVDRRICRQMQKISESLSLIFQQTIVNGKYIPRHLDIVIAQNSHQTFKTTFRSKL